MRTPKRVTQHLSYRPAPLRAPVTLEIGAGGLRHRGGPLRRWPDLVAVRFGSWRDRHTRWITLRLRFRTGQEVLHFTCAASDRDLPGGLRAVLARITEAHPGLQVRTALVAAAQWTMFAIGVASVVLAAGLLGAALVTGVTRERLLSAAVPVTLLGLVGFALILSFRPGRGAASVPVERLLADP